MRWTRLFADLAGQLESAERAERDAEVADRSRLEVSRLRLADRLHAAVGVEVTLGIAGAAPVRGRIGQVGPDWLLLADATSEVLVALAAVSWLAGLPALADPTDDVARDRLGLGHVLRRLARDRASLLVLLRDGRTLTGTIDRVGADAFDLAEHPADEPRRAPSVRRSRVVPFAAVALLRPG